MIAIIMGTYNRGHLLERSLHHYDKVEGIELVVMDDGSTDNTRDICENAKTKVHYFYLGDNTGWRDSASFLNSGIRFALGELNADYIFITHPEIIPGFTTIKNAVRLADHGSDVWVSCKGYYLTPYSQKDIESCNWKESVLEVRKLKDFYTLPTANCNNDYLPVSIDKIQVWHSWIFGGGSKAFWQYFGGLTEFDNWGSIDVDLFNRREVTGIRTMTPNEETDIVIHQNHDELGTPKDMTKCMAVLPIYNSKEEALKTHILYE